MGRPAGNGLVEMVDEKSHDRGFFCMKLVGFIMEEAKDQLTMDHQELYLLRFAEAKAGACSYRDICPKYKKTMAGRKQSGYQLSFDFAD